MKIFGHGRNHNYHTSTIEMNPEHLVPLVRSYLEPTAPLLFGKLDYDQMEIYTLGHLKEFEVKKDANVLAFSFTLLQEPKTDFIYQSIDELFITNEGIFDLIIQNENGEDKQVEYRVLYFTWLDEETGDEATYFFARDEIVPEPLACVGEFWPLVYEVGRDVDFMVTGCQANEMKEILKRIKLK